MTDCRHIRCDIIEDRSGSICTRCGAVIDSFMFGDYVEHEHHHHHAPPPSPKKYYECSKTELRQRESADMISSVCRDMSLPDIVHKTAISLYKDVLEAKGFRGEQFKLSTVSAVYFACKFHKLSRGEVEFAANVPWVLRSKLTAMNKKIRRIFERSSYAHMFSQRLDPMHLVPRFLAVLSIDETLLPRHVIHPVRNRLETLLESWSEQLEGRTPECLCAAACTHAIEQELGFQIERKRVAERCGISLASIMNILKIIESP